MMAPIDWDRATLCVEDDCAEPAVHRRDLGKMAGEFPTYEMVCCRHALVEYPDE